MQAEVKQEIPAGYMKNAQGHLVPEELVKPVDKLRTEMVSKMMQKARTLQGQIHTFKYDSYDQLTDFLDLIRDEYGAKVGGKKGNITLTSYDGTQKVQIAVGENYDADERISVAIELLEQFIAERLEGVDDYVKTLVTQAYQTNKKGQLSYGRLMSLRHFDIDHPIWNKAMKAIEDGIHIINTKNYIRFYTRDSSEGQWKAIPLDIASL